MGVIFGVLSLVIVVALLALLTTGIVAFHRGHLTFETVIHIYTTFVLAVCIVLALCGGALLLKSILSAVIARDFSYQVADFPRVGLPGGTAPSLPTAADRARTQAGDDLTAGITLLVIGVGIGAVHAVGNALAARRDALHGGMVARGFDVAMLAVGVGVGLASGAMLLNALLRRYIVTAAPAEPFTRPRPGGALGYAVLFVPLWVYFARRVWRTLAAPHVTAARDPVPPGESAPLA